MLTFFDILVNISPIIILLDMFITFKGTQSEKTYWNILNIFSTIISLLSLISAVNGCGIFIMSIITIILTVIWYLIMAFWYWIEHDEKYLLYTIHYAIYAIVVLLLLFYRLKLEGIIEIEFIDRLQDLDIFKALSSIIQNEWFKGIAIAASGGIIAGLVLNEISKKK